MRKPAIVAEKSSGNVFADLGLPNATIETYAGAVGAYWYVISRDGS